jgi:hypothetical protein
MNTVFKLILIKPIQNVNRKKQKKIFCVTNVFEKMLLFFKHLFGDGSYTGDMQHFDILFSYSQTILNNLPKLKISYGVLKKFSLLIGPEVKKNQGAQKNLRLSTPRKAL